MNPVRPASPPTCRTLDLVYRSCGSRQSTKLQNCSSYCSTWAGDSRDSFWRAIQDLLKFPACSLEREGGRNSRNFPSCRTGDGNVTPSRVHSPPGPDAKGGQNPRNCWLPTEGFLAALARRPNAARRTLASGEMVPGFSLPVRTTRGANILGISSPPASRVGDDFSRKGPAPKGAYWPV